MAASILIDGATTLKIFIFQKYKKYQKFQRKVSQGIEYLLWWIPQWISCGNKEVELQFLDGLKLTVNSWASLG